MPIYLKLYLLGKQIICVYVVSKSGIDIKSGVRLGQRDCHEQRGAIEI